MAWGARNLISTGEARGPHAPRASRRAARLRLPFETTYLLTRGLSVCDAAGRLMSLSGPNFCARAANPSYAGRSNRVT